MGFDVFNALDLMQNKTFLEKLKFGIGDGYLQYYLYNWRCSQMEPTQVVSDWPMVVRYLVVNMLKASVNLKFWCLQNFAILHYTDSRVHEFVTLPYKLT